MVRAHAGQNRAEISQAGEDVEPDHRMFLDLLELTRGKCSRLPQNLVVDTDLPDVVQQPGEIDVPQVLGGQAEMLAQAAADQGDPFAMAARVGVLASSDETSERTNDSSRSS